MMNARELFSRLQGAVLLATHHQPDGDAVGSVLGLSALIQTAGGRPSCFFPAFPRIFNYLRGSHQILESLPEATNFDAVVVLDCGSPSQVAGGIEHLPRTKLLAVVDHHRTRESFGQVEFVDASASATGLIVAELAQDAGIAFSRDAARALWAAILTDTGSFRYSSTDARTLRMGAQLLEAGADPWEAAQSIYENYEFSRQRLLGLCLATLEMHCGGKVASMYLTREMVRSVQASMDASTGFINYARSVSGVEIAFFVRQDETAKNTWRVAFRSRGNHPVDRIAAHFSGGGHYNAAGCTITGDLHDVMARVADAIREVGGLS